MPPSSTKDKVQRWAKRYECPIDEDANYQNTFWCNRDLIPIPNERRTWAWQDFAGYWVITGTARKPSWISSFSLRPFSRHEHISMDRWLKFAGSGLVSRAIDGSGYWYGLINCYNCCASGLDGKSSTYRLHGSIKGVICPTLTYCSIIADEL